jgi:hypothetical protein
MREGWVAECGVEIWSTVAQEWGGERDVGGQQGETYRGNDLGKGKHRDDGLQEAAQEQERIHVRKKMMGAGR